MTDLFPELNAPVEKLIRRAAAEIIMPCFQKLMPDQVRYKNTREIVTDLDEQVEDFLSKHLTALLPGSTIIGEEKCHREPGCLDHLVNDKWTWLIDPIDGTNNFVRHSDDFGIMVALVHRGKPHAGWIYMPIYDSFISGNAYIVCRNQVPFAMAQRHVRPLQSLHALYRQRDKNMVEKVKQFNTYHDTHCAAFDFSLLLSGDADFIVYPGSRPWDVAAGSVLLEALGGRAAKLDGSPLEGQGLQQNAAYLATRSAADWADVAQALA